MEATAEDLVRATAALAKAHLTTGTVPAADAATLVRRLAQALASRPVPDWAVVTPDGRHVVCLEDGLPYRSMRRRLRAAGLAPRDYRQRWGLGPRSPLTAPGYSQEKSREALAKGLGTSAVPRRGRSLA